MTTHTPALAVLALTLACGPVPGDPPLAESPTTIADAHLAGDFGPLRDFAAPAAVAVSPTDNGIMSIVAEHGDGAAMLVIRRDPLHALICSGPSAGDWDFDRPADVVATSITPDGNGGQRVLLIADGAEATWWEPVGFVTEASP